MGIYLYLNVSTFNISLLQTFGLAYMRGVGFRDGWIQIKGSLFISHKTSGNLFTLSLSLNFQYLNPEILVPNFKYYYKTYISETCHTVDTNRMLAS